MVFCRCRVKHTLAWQPCKNEEEQPQIDQKSKETVPGCDELTKNCYLSPKLSEQRYIVEKKFRDLSSINDF